MLLTRASRSVLPVPAVMLDDIHQPLLTKIYLNQSKIVCVCVCMSVCVWKLKKSSCWADPLSLQLLLITHPAYVSMDPQILSSSLLTTIFIASHLVLNFPWKSISSFIFASLILSMQARVISWYTSLMSYLLPIYFPFDSEASKKLLV